MASKKTAAKKPSLKQKTKAAAKEVAAIEKAITKNSTVATKLGAKLEKARAKLVKLEGKAAPVSA